jgi:diguanylate cyclase
MSIADWGLLPFGGQNSIPASAAHERQGRPCQLKDFGALHAAVALPRAESRGPRSGAGHSSRPTRGSIQAIPHFGGSGDYHFVVRHRKAERFSTTRLIATYALISLIPVLLLGAVLAVSYQTEARQRGLAEGTSEALLVAETAVEPRLTGHPLSQGLTAAEGASMRALTDRVVGDHNVLRLRLRDLSGNVVFSDDGSGLKKNVDDDDEALEAAHGEVVARLTYLNDDSDDTGPKGPAAVEVYLPLTAGKPEHRVGVLEIYLPYAPINVDVTASLHNLYRDLAIGLVALYLALFVISTSVSRRLRQQLRVNTHLAEHDSLTDLPNRTAFHRQAEAVCIAARRDKSSVVIGIVDLDRFKEINDTLGHHNGDRLLNELARRLSGFLRPQDTVGRLGGDEFGIILRDITEPEPVFWRIRMLIEHEVMVAGLPLSVDSSIGYVVAPADGTDIDELLQLADVAMYVAKAQHSGVARYDPKQNHYDPAKLTLMGDFRQAIETNQLVLHYQPKLRLEDGRIDSVEALVRWQHPTRGLLYPDQFVPLAEQTDLIERLTGWVLTRALIELNGLGPSAAHLTMAVNISARNLGRLGFAQRVAQTLDRVGASADRLTLELTETALLTDPARAASSLAEVSRLGIRVSIDDFGCGQTSLGYLSTLPIDELKIDRSFICDMLENSAHAAIVRSIVDLGHNLGVRVVAEGVETRAILTALRAIGCDLAQGYLFARPMPADQLRGWMATEAPVHPLEPTPR